MSRYEVKLGRGSQRWESRYDFYVPKAHSDGDCGVYDSIDGALDHPVASPSLEEMAKKASTIAICIPDMTRGWCQSPKMNKVVRDRIAAANPNARVTWIVATGQHRPVLPEEMDMVFGECLHEGDVWVSHYCDKTVDTGLKTSTGTPVLLAPDFIDKDLAVLVGGIIFHDMAGFSGGRKMLMPGIAGRAAIVKNHNHCLTDQGLNPLTDSGLIENNPMAHDQEEFATLALQGKPCFLLNAIGDEEGNPTHWVAGDLWEAWKLGCAACKSYASLYIPGKADRCVISCGGFPFDMDLYQATKALFAPLASMKKGAPVVLVADLEECLGPEDFSEGVKRSLANPDEYAEHVKKHFTIPTYVALRMILELKEHPAALVTSRKDALFPGRIFSTMEEADRWLQEVSGTDGLSILVPTGNSIHVYVE